MTYAEFKQELVDERLAAGQCVWCGRQLGVASDSDVFCKPEHQWSWHQWRNGKTDEVRPERPPLASLNDVAPGGAEPDDVRSEPWYVPSAAEVPPLDTLQAALPDDLAQRYWPQLQQDAGQHAFARSQRPGLLAGRADLAPESAQLGEGGARLGGSVLPGQPALVSLPPEPEFSTYPHPQLHWLTWKVRPYWHNLAEVTTRSRTGETWIGRLGWVRQCPDCGTRGLPRASTSTQWGVPRDSVVCPTCLGPYPGPACVPLVRQVAGVWHLALATHHGVWVDQLLPGADPGARWMALHSKAQAAAAPPCHVPDCPARALPWYALAGALTLGRYLWAPIDGQVLRVGLCSTHAGHVTTLAHSPAMQHRTDGPDPVTGRLIIR